MNEWDKPERRRWNPEQEIRHIYDALRRLETSHKDALESVEKRFEDVRDELVSKVEFAPVKLLVYSLVGIILAAVIGAVVALVVQSGSIPRP